MTAKKINKAPYMKGESFPRKYILVYSRQQTEDCETEQLVEFKDTEQALHDRVTELAPNYKRFNVDFAGEISKEWQYKAVQEPKLVRSNASPK